MQHSLKVLTLTSALDSSSLIEPEDARITGLTRSLSRRLLALNLPKVAMRKATMKNISDYPQSRIA